jgi:hypothetical protein
MDRDTSVNEHESLQRMAPGKFWTLFTKTTHISVRSCQCHFWVFHLRRRLRNGRTPVVRDVHELQLICSEYIEKPILTFCTAYLLKRSSLVNYDGLEITFSRNGGAAIDSSPCSGALLQGKSLLLDPTRAHGLAATANTSARTRVVVSRMDRCGGS